MGEVVLVAAVAFPAGALCCHLFWRWYQSIEIQEKIAELRALRLDRKINMGGGVTYARPFRLGKTQSRSDNRLHGISDVRISRRDGYVEIYGSWNKNNKDQIDPYSLCLPASAETANPNALIEFGEYFVALGRQLHEQPESTAR